LPAEFLRYREESETNFYVIYCIDDSAWFSLPVLFVAQSQYSKDVRTEISCRLRLEFTRRVLEFHGV
jgi:hypothetical protein